MVRITEKSSSFVAQDNSFLEERNICIALEQLV